MTRIRITNSMLRECARHALDAANWLERYERSSNPEHRRNALLALMEARDTLQRVETVITEGLATAQEVSR